MSSRKLNFHNRKPMTKKRFIQLLEQHLNDTGLMTAFTVPPVTLEEEQRSRFLANDICQKLDKSDSPRVRALTAVRMYQMNVNGLVGWLKNHSALPAPVTNTETALGGATHD